MYWRLVQLLIWLTMWGTLPTRMNGFWAPKAAVWTVGGFLLATSAWWRPAPRQTPWAPWLGLLMAWMILRFAWQVYRPQLFIPSSLATTFIMPWPGMALSAFLAALASVLALESLIRQTAYVTQWTKVASWLCWSAGLVALYGVAQLCGLDPLTHVTKVVAGQAGGDHAPITVYGNRGLTAQVLAVCAPLCLMFRPWHYRLFYGLMVVVIVASTSLSATVAVWVATVYLLSTRQAWRSVSFAALAPVVAVGCVSATHQWGLVLASWDRMAMWSQALAIWLKNPLSAWVGFGLGAVESAHTHGFWTWHALNCEPLQIVFELGLIGGLFMVGWLISFVWMVWAMPKSLASQGWVAATLAYAMISCLNFPLRIGTTLMLGVLCVAACYAHAGGGLDA